MSIARIRSASFKSEEKADIMEALYDKHCRTYLPMAEDILAIRTDELTVLFVTIYPNEKAANEALGGVIKFFETYPTVVSDDEFFLEGPVAVRH